MSKPTIANVSAALTRAGWPSAEGGRDGFKVRPHDSGVICVEYLPGTLPASRDRALTAMARVLSAEGWLVTEAGRVLVSGGGMRNAAGEEEAGRG